MIRFFRIEKLFVLLFFIFPDHHSTYFQKFHFTEIDILAAQIEFRFEPKSLLG